MGNTERKKEESKGEQRELERGIGEAKDNKKFWIDTKGNDKETQWRKSETERGNTMNRKKMQKGKNIQREKRERKEGWERERVKEKEGSPFLLSVIIFCSITEFYESSCFTHLLNVFYVWSKSKLHWSIIKNKSAIYFTQNEFKINQVLSSFCALKRKSVTWKAPKT